MKDLAEVLTFDGLEGIGRYYSIYKGIVTKNDDPACKNRLKVCVPQVKGIILWAEPKGQHGAYKSGFKFLTPKVGDFVWVEFEGGDLSKPVWSYHGWANGEIPLALNNPDIMGLVTPKGNIITLDESDGHLDIFINGDIVSFSHGPIKVCSGELVEINGGNNGGVINISELTQKLNQLVSEIEALKATFNTHTHSGVTIGGGTSAVPVTPHSSNFSTFSESDYEDQSFTH